MVANRKANRQRIQFAFNADVDSVVGAVFQHLIKNHLFSSREGKRKGVDAMVAFYKPFAFQGREDVTDDELRSMAQDAIELLSRQIELLCGAFGVERPSAIALDLKTEIKEAIAETLTTESIRVHQDPSHHPFTSSVFDISSIADLSISDGRSSDGEFDFDEDLMLGDLCSNAEAAA